MKRALLLCLLLSGCVAGPDYRPPDLAASGAPLTLPTRSASGDGAAAIPQAWWAQFNDPVLDRLVERGLAGNLEIAAATYRLASAGSQFQAERGALLPRVSSSRAVTGSQGSDVPGGDNARFSSGVTASWEVPLFGTGTRAVEAARAGAEAQAAQLQAVRLAIVGEIARTYVQLRLAEQRHALSSEILAAQRDTAQIATWRAQAGLVSAIDVEQSRQLVAQTAAGLPALLADRRAAASRLALLCGVAPGAIDADLAAGTPLPTSFAVPGMLPADIIRNRPDVSAAERSLAAETARIGVVAARLRPGLTLSGTLSGSSTSATGIVDQLIGQLSASIGQLLFDGGRTRALVAAQEAVVEAALADYRTALLTALEDADNGYASLDASRNALTLREEAARASGAAVSYLRLQYQAGLIDFRALLDAERNFLGASEARLLAEADVLLANVRLAQALGGGFNYEQGKSSDS